MNDVQTMEILFCLNELPLWLVYYLKGQILILFYTTRTVANSVTSVLIIFLAPLNYFLGS